MIRVREFDEAGYFAWLYDGDKTMSNLMTAGLVLGPNFSECSFGICR